MLMNVTPKNQFLQKSPERILRKIQLLIIVIQLSIIQSLIIQQMNNTAVNINTAANNTTNE